jgi:hypothetical protein
MVRKSYLARSSWSYCRGANRIAAGVAVDGIMAYEFEKHLWQKVLEVVKKESGVNPTIDSVDHYHD